MSEYYRWDDEAKSLALFDEDEVLIIAKTYATVAYHKSWDDLPEPIRREYITVGYAALDTIDLKRKRAAARGSLSD